MHFQVGFQKQTDGQNIVITDHNQHFNVMVLRAPAFKKLPFGIVLRVKKVTQKDNAGCAGALNELVKSDEVVFNRIGRERNALFSEMRNLAQMEVSDQ